MDAVVEGVLQVLEECCASGKRGARLGRWRLRRGVRLGVVVKEFVGFGAKRTAFLTVSERLTDGRACKGQPEPHCRNKGEDRCTERECPRGRTRK